MAMARDTAAVDLTKLSAREIVQRVEALRRENAARGLPAPGTAEALLHYIDHEPKPEFEPGELERLLEEVYRMREEDC